MKTIKTAKTIGMNAVPVIVETQITSGVGIHLVGLADAAVKESLIRTVTALMANGFHIPGKKIVINLAPADLYKSGSGHDLAIALSLIGESGQKVLSDLDKWLVFGELGLDGSIRSVPGALQAAMCAIENGYKCIIPAQDIEELRPYVGQEAVYGIATLADAIKLISGENEFPTIAETPVKESVNKGPYPKSAWDSIIGQETARRGLQIAAAGGHNVLLVGAPGSGKSMLAKALTEILPPMTADEALENSLVYSAAARGYQDYYGGRRPFRAPYYSASMSAMLGGGSADVVMPGEVSLANNGVLYLDEAPLFPKSLMEALRGPLEDKKVIISRLKSRIEYPAKFQLVLASNPCPCGYYGEGDRCTCTPNQRLAYLSKLSGPVMDNVAIQLWVHPMPEPKEGKPLPEHESADAVRERVTKARQIQAERFKDESYKLNDEMPAKDIERFVVLSQECKELIERVITSLGLSARSYSRILKIARTIADLDGADKIAPAHVCEAASYRFLDRHDAKKTSC